MCRLLTVGHGTLPAEKFAALLAGPQVQLLVDVRSVPASRRHPHFARAELGSWLPEAGVAYRWEQALGGFRRARADSPNVALVHPSFRGYADWMDGEAFVAALSGVLGEAASARTTVMCSESLWWRCHRRLIADAAVLLHDAEVDHLFHDGRLSPHRLTSGVRVEGARLVYDIVAGESPSS
ncbi:MAG: DUF488 family protein [Acidimicrobiales bacterium]